jgi:hypothetical protein
LAQSVRSLIPETLGALLPFHYVPSPAARHFSTKGSDRTAKRRQLLFKRGAV